MNEAALGSAPGEERPDAHLTEQRVREIVREEIAQRKFTRMVLQTPSARAIVENLASDECDSAGPDGWLSGLKRRLAKPLGRASGPASSNLAPSAEYCEGCGRELVEVVRGKDKRFDSTTGALVAVGNRYLACPQFWRNDRIVHTCYGLGDGRTTRSVVRRR